MTPIDAASPLPVRGDKGRVTIDGPDQSPSSFSADT
jgi:hypothetical protein